MSTSTAGSRAETERPSVPVSGDASGGSTRAPGRRSTGSLLPEVGWCLLSAIVALAVAAWNLQLWDARPYVPFTQQTSDGAYVLGLVKGIVDTGWFFENPSLGAPFGQDGYDFSTTFGDFWNLAIIRAGAVVSDDPALLLNVFYVLTYALNAVSAHVVLRALSISRPVCVVCAVLFSVLPFHFLRGEVHVFLAAYWAVPLGGWLVLGILGHVELFARRDGARLGGWFTWPTARTLLCAFVIAGAAVYWAVFTLMLAVVATLAVALRGRSLRSVVPGAVVTVAVGASVLLYTSPSLIYSADRGANPIVGQRAPAESVIYGLSAAQLLLPRPEHRSERLAGAAQDYGRSSPIQSEGSSASIGLLLGGAFVVGVVFCLLGGARRRETPTADLVADSGMISAAAFLMGTIGGGSALVAYLLSPQLRGWGRVSIPIAFFSTVILAVGLQRLWARGLRGDGRRPAVLAGAALVAVGAFGVWDQTAPTDRPTYEIATAQWQTSGRFVRSLEATLPESTMVLQLPYVPFPENPPVNAMADYDHLRPYLQSEDLRWSYAAMKGRPEDWMAATGNLSTEELVRASATAGFGAVWIDRNGYVDRGAAVESDLAPLADGPPVVSADGRVAVYAVSRLRTALPPARRGAVTEQLLEPVFPEYSSGFSEPEGTFRWMGREAKLRLDAPGDGPRDIRLGFALRGAPGTVAVTLPDGSTRNLLTGPDAPKHRLTVRVAPGADVVTLATDVPGVAAPGDTRDLRVQVDSLAADGQAIVALDG